MGAGKVHPPELRERAVQMVFDLRAESGNDRGSIQRVAERIYYTAWGLMYRIFR
jgi:hypothetical protein